MDVLFYGGITEILMFCTSLAVVSCCSSGSVYILIELLKYISNTETIPFILVLFLFYLIFFPCEGVFIRGYFVVKSFYGEHF